MRITMGMISSQYKGSLNSTLERLNNASNTATDLRRFNKASDDPYSAAMAFKLRREYQRNDDYQSNLSDVSSKLDTAGSAITKVEEIAQEAGQSDVIGAINGSMSETGRKAIAEKLRTMREAIVSSMNTELGGEFLFGGSENSEPPFTVDEAGNLLYRGVNVDTGLDKNGNAVDLDALGKEKAYVDLGLGLKTNPDGTVQSQSAFNASMPGISYIGYGKTADGVPKNLYSLMGDIADQLESGDFSIKKIQPYLDQFSKTQDNLLTKMTDIGARSKSVEYTQSRLEDTEDNLIKKSDDVEYVNPADAYTDLKMADFGYTAALKIGENILRPTFLDFMK